MKEKIKTLKIIHLAICAGMIVAYIFIGESTMEQMNSQEINSENAIYLVVPIVAFFVSNLMFKSKLKQIDSSLTLEEKLPFYQTASIIRWAILEGAAFLILFIKPEFIILGIIIILYLAYLRPTEDKIVSDLKSNI